MEGGVYKQGGRKSIMKMERLTMNYSRTIIDKVNKLMISGKNASNTLLPRNLVHALIYIAEAKVPALM